jgi:hypothetical protein
MITVGQVVQIKPKWRDDGDNDFTFIVACLDNYPRITIKAAEQNGMPIQPIYTVLPYMLEGFDHE